MIAPIKRFGIARIISKQGIASRTQAAQWVREGKVRVNGRLCRDPETPFRPGVDQYQLDNSTSKRTDAAAPPTPTYVLLNKPRGLITSTRDEQQRDTVYRCFEGADLPWLAPVGRLDKASEGLLLFTNDSQWAAGITAPSSGLRKTYHVQVDCVPSIDVLQQMQHGLEIGNEIYTAQSVDLLRHGQKNAWLTIVLSEGKNRHIRRMLQALDIEVLRLIRVSIGELELGTLAKGQWRVLSEAERQMLVSP